MTTLLGPAGDGIELYARWHGHAGGHPIGPFGTVDELTNYMTRCRLPKPDDWVVPSGPRVRSGS